jgi:hypothetical protein
VVVAHVGLTGEDASAFLLDERGRLGEIGRRRHRVGHLGDVRTEVDRHDVGALFRQPHGVRPPLPPGGTGDERDLSVELSHA